MMPITTVAINVIEPNIMTPNNLIPLQEDGSGSSVLSEIGKRIILLHDT